MLREILVKSRGVRGAPDAGGSPRLPAYSLIGLAVIIAGEALLFAGVSFIRVWFTPIMWSGYILFMDGLILRRKRASLLSDHPLEFVLLLLISIGSWAIFEGYNVFLKNWTYIGLPDNLLVRYIGYAWAFATISPAIFITFEFLDLVLPGSPPLAPARLKRPVFFGSLTLGAICLTVPLIWPTTYMSPLVWMGFAFFLDPINGSLGDRSFLTDFFTGRFRSTLIMFLAGLICGILWEFWNYWAATKWHYDVPYLGHIKIFEMPVLGFLGFLPFAVECYAIYIFIRRIIPIPRQVRYLG
jgi:hypothetical protein